MAYCKGSRRYPRACDKCNQFVIDFQSLKNFVKKWSRNMDTTFAKILGLTIFLNCVIMTNLLMLVNIWISGISLRLRVQSQLIFFVHHFPWRTWLSPLILRAYHLIYQHFYEVIFKVGYFNGDVNPFKRRIQICR